jgi:hypothetical protein
MKRRSLIKGTLASAGLACSYAGLAATGNRQRRNIASFSADEVKIFREAVLDMQSKSAADPESWNYLAAVHRYWPYSSNAEAQKYQHPDVLKTIDFDALAKVPAEERTKYWRACIHHDHPATSHFLSWHRLYLWHFETALLAATDIAAARLGLPRSISGVPYWDYYASPRLPDAFRIPMISGRPNPLYVPYRNQAINAGTKGVITADLDAFRMGDMLNQPIIINGETRRGFSGALERPVHDNVHSEIGGLMTNQNNASWDPVFWLHHANIDRLWTIWQQRTSATSDTSITPEWRRKTFTFKSNAAGALFEGSAGNTADGKSLAPNIVTYDSLVPPAKTPPTPLPKAPPVIAVASSLSPMKNGTNALTSDVRKVGVTNSGGTITLNVPSANRSRLGTLGNKLTSRAGAKDLTWAAVVLEGISITAQGQRDGFVYHVYMNLPATHIPDADPDMYKIGALSSFSLSCIDPEICTSGKANARFVITEQLVKIMNDKKAPNSIDVSLVRITAKGPDGKLVPPEPSSALLEITAIRLEGSNDPLM